MQKTRHRFLSDYSPKDPRNRSTFFVEVSIIKNKIFVLAVEAQQSKQFDNSLSFQNVNSLDNNNTRVLMTCLWKKQIQSMFMQIYYFKKQKDEEKKMQNRENSQESLDDTNKNQSLTDRTNANLVNRQNSNEPPKMTRKLKLKLL